MEAVRKACAVPSDVPPLEHQFLFNVYTHPKPSFKGAPILVLMRSSHHSEWIGCSNLDACPLVYKWLPLYDAVKNTCGHVQSPSI